MTSKTQPFGTNSISSSLLRSSVSQSSVIFQIFHKMQPESSLYYSLRFRESLKGEIGVFFPLIVLRSLDSSDGPMNQRASVLWMLESAYLFWFYPKVLALSKIAQGTFNADPHSTLASQTNQLKCFVSVLKSLVDWEMSHRKHGKQNSSTQFTEEDVFAKDYMELRSYNRAPFTGFHLGVYSAQICLTSSSSSIST
ncbi:hypothetical protein IFM89_015858 [Coptis chinensis]|uniref:Mon2/Sec7/BIG1-like HUS domain-containing protein n=1 Tax=Coptis chinensis TaxID=261450 RepID=A0A835INP7_9MAGN|nr:hypothetical protein IFM89_015858 [Coptis chinensis]